ncbi:restriction endonuclease subunit S [Actinotalea sp. M2MS4P-6]|uniref:restriction endonuclease subunit S n=1 Tax=Actinotalea sp. M2MS4P-6 TaxID=2983762 RepID=UPI0021E4302A|nr:restriction endonuclease subunit S [Actinotalea sp. M2MS4P-6]MCV2393269.1 restriction endonuclease subunit S [Actinotalea sp. M2MS4P-6]
MASADWGFSTVAEEFRVQLGKRLDAAVNRGELRWCINNRGVRWGQILVEEAIRAPLTPTDIRDLRLAEGDVLVCEGGEIGRAAVWRGELKEAYFLNTLHRLRSKGYYHPSLLVAYLERWASTGELSALVGKATLAHLTKENLLRVPLPVLPEPEQGRVVDALRSADELISALEGVLLKKRAIKQGVLQELVGGLDAPVRQLSELGVTVRGVSYDPIADLSTHPAADTVNLLRANNVRDGRLALKDVQFVHRRRVKSDQRLRRGDVLICAANGSKQLVGKAAAIDLLGRGSTFGAFMMVYRPDRSRVLPSYMALHFQTKAYRDWVELLLAGSSINNLRPSDVAAFSIMLPNGDTQKRIAAVLADADAEIDALERRLEATRSIKQGMMQELLTGRTRLVPAEAGL